VKHKQSGVAPLLIIVILVIAAAEFPFLIRVVKMLIETLLFGAPIGRGAL